MEMYILYVYQNSIVFFWNVKKKFYDYIRTGINFLVLFDPKMASANIVTMRSGTSVVIMYK